MQTKRRTTVFLPGGSPVRVPVPALARRLATAIGALVPLLVIALAPAPSAAQVATCDQRQTVLGLLAQKYHEAPVASGITSTGGLIEVLATDDGETWTIIVSSPDGTSCLIAAGEGWRAIKFDDTARDPSA
ncbi:MAG: hypothetical protein D6685_03105 [Bacteroidetes bacterium]|nr:MAG: hypothetical protein D6685_03105 [Bacteroidota bacterium]